MLSKKEIKDIQSLSQKKFRKELKLFVAEGPKIVAELMELIPHQIEKIYALEEWITSNKLSSSSNLVAVSAAELERISGLQTPNRVVAVIRQFETTEPLDASFVLYLDTIQDPGNFGTIIRTADWFNVKHIVCTEDCADLYNPKVVQATMASIARVNVFYDENGKWLKKQKAPIYAAGLQGKASTGFSKTEKGILVIGNESKGISAEIMKLATDTITIPKKGDAESLNAAVATGILLSSLLR